MRIPYTYHGQKKSISPQDATRLPPSELQAVILAASLLGLEGLLPAYLILKGGRP
ncbi:MAG: hypothetical protein LBK63_06855 [Treponema sp.]|jgi:hypothetical protein|nr:hypothetical protein [Treponema sp.]